MNPRILLLAVALLVAADSSAEEPARRKLLVVQKLVTDGADKDVSRFAGDLTEELVVSAASLSRPNGVDVRSESELQLMTDQVKDMADLRPEDCTKLEECLARIFEGEADYVLRGTLGRLGDEWIVTLKLIDLKTMGVLRPRSFAGETREEVVERLPTATAEVLGYASKVHAEAPIEIPADGRKIAVSITGADDKKNATLTEIAVISIRNFGYGTQTTSDVLEMIHYATERTDVTGASLTEAIMEIAASSGVSMLVIGSVGRAESTHLITLKLIDLQKAEVSNRVLESFIGEEEHLRGAMKYACARLFGRLPTGEAGPTSIVTDVEGWYRIDQGKNEPLPQVTARMGLPAGKRQLNISSPGYFPYYSDVYLFDEPLRYRPRLEPLPEPWYESPLFLTIAGVVVAGTAAAVTLAVLPTGPESRGRLEER